MAIAPACQSRPPSGRRDNVKIIRDYTRQLSKTSAKKIDSSNISKPSFGDSKVFTKVGHIHHSKSNSMTNTTSHLSNRGKRRPRSAVTPSTQGKNRSSKNHQCPQSARTVRWERDIEGEPTCLGNLGKANSLSLAPFVCGFNNTREFSQSEPDLSKLEKPLKSCLKKTVRDKYFEKRSKEEIEELTDKALGVLDDDEDTDEELETGYISLPLPKSLHPLAHYWTPDIPPEYLGIDHLHCWVFLPSMVKSYQDLTVVPPQVTDPKETLPYKEKIEEPVPWFKRYKEEWVCQHRRTVPPLQVFDDQGRLMHETVHQKRTIDVVRKEISELELLMKGIGTEGGCSLVVQYQYEINKLQAMVDNTLGRVEEIERREKAKQKAIEAKVKDYFGLRKFYKEHDEIMRQIRLQHDKCVKELAILERDLKIDTHRAHFRQKHQQQLDSH